jgi:hypothetical protein
MGDYGKWKKWMIACWWAMQFGFLGLKPQSQY